MNVITTHHLDKSTQTMNQAEDRLFAYMQNCDPADPQMWENIMDLSLKFSGASFAAQQEFKIEHFLAKSLISSI